jgi:RimJ/RimL family protein N-acetyltransferase
MSMDRPLLRGERVRLTAVNPETDAEASARWTRDTEYWRLNTTDPASPWTARSVKEFMERGQQEERDDDYSFSIRLLEDDRLIGWIGLDGVDWPNGDAWVGIGIGERDCWGKGYGTDAMRVLLRYAFMELSLHRVSLSVYEYNPRAIRSYEKAGFVHEGRLRQAIQREGRRWDLLYMGILRGEWERGATTSTSRSTSTSTST